MKQLRVIKQFLMILIGFFLFERNLLAVREEVALDGMKRGRGHRITQLPKEEHVLMNRRTWEATPLTLNSGPFQTISEPGCPIIFFNWITREEFYILKKEEFLREEQRRKVESDRKLALKRASDAHKRAEDEIRARKIADALIAEEEAEQLAKEHAKAKAKVKAKVKKGKGKNKKSKAKKGKPVSQKKEEKEEPTGFSDAETKGSVERPISPWGYNLEKIQREAEELKKKGEAERQRRKQKEELKRQERLKIKEAKKKQKKFKEQEQLKRKIIEQKKKEELKKEHQTRRRAWFEATEKRNALIASQREAALLASQKKEEEKKEQERLKQLEKERLNEEATAEMKTLPVIPSSDEYECKHKLKKAKRFLRDFLKHYIEDPRNSHLKFILDGGFLVNFYGFGYQTSDLDLVVGCDPTYETEMKDVREDLLEFLQSKIDLYRGYENYLVKEAAGGMILKISERYPDGKIVPLIDIGIHEANKIKTQEKFFEVQKGIREDLSRSFGVSLLNCFKLNVYRRRLEDILAKFLKKSNLTLFGQSYRHKLKSWLNQYYCITVKNWEERTLRERRKFLDLYKDLLPFVEEK